MMVKSCKGCGHPQLDIRDLDWSIQRRWVFEEGTHWLCASHVATLRASAYLYGQVSGFRVHTYIQKGSPNRRLVINFYGKRCSK